MCIRDRLYIEDNGCGVKACDLPYIFDKGFTGSDINVSKKPTGMGLYLAREMATDLGLKLYAVSEYREGLTMKVQIPIVDRPCAVSYTHLLSIQGKCV